MNIASSSVGGERALATKAITSGALMALIPGHYTATATLIPFVHPLVVVSLHIARRIVQPAGKGRTEELSQKTH